MATCKICRELGITTPIDDSPMPEMCTGCYEQGAPWARRCVIDTSGCFSHAEYDPMPAERLLDMHADGDITALIVLDDLIGWSPYTLLFSAVDRYGDTVYWMLEDNICQRLIKSR